MKEIKENSLPDNETSAEVVIDGKVIPVAGGETAYLQKVAAYIDGKIAALKKTRQYGRQNSELRSVMLWLNLADDYMQAREEADRLKAEAEERKGNFVTEVEGGFRRIVASPKPKEIIELDAIKALLKDDQIVICCGGGGIPVMEQGVDLRGASAVIEKDLISGLLAIELGADTLMILTSVDEVSLNNAKLLALTGTNNFAVKKLLSVDDITSNYLVYCPLSYEKPEETAAVLNDGELDTGDLGSLDEQNCLHLNGRKNEVLVLPNGTKVFCPEWETELSKRMQGEAAITSENGKLVLHVYTALSDDEVKSNADAFNDQQPAGRKLGGLVRHKNHLPRTATGKLQRWKLNEEGVNI